MAEQLTLQQIQAIENQGGNLLVSAAAGSGKTKVLVDRVMRHLTDPNHPSNIDDFLIITYTKAAASELRGKIAAKLTQAVANDPENRHLQRQMQRLFMTKISTVHGFCAEILREYAYQLDIPADFRVVDENECNQIREEVLRDLLEHGYTDENADPYFLAFIDSQGVGRDDRLASEIILKVFNSAICHLDPYAWLEGCVRDAECITETDAGQTTCGRYLIDDLKYFVRLQISSLDRCINELEKYSVMDKPVQNLNVTRGSLQKIINADTWDEIVAAKDIEFGRLTFPRKFEDPDLIDRTKAVRNACKQEIEKKLVPFQSSSVQVLNDLNGMLPGLQGMVSAVKAFGESYQRVKKSRRVLDFSDLEHLTLDLLLGKKRNTITALAKEIGSRFCEVMVDEYQDSNGVQDAIFRAITQEKHNCFMVGDVKQSIYQFRLADPGIFLEKYQSYASSEHAQPGEGRKVLLSHNFRSGPEIIEAVNSVFRMCMCKEVGGLQYSSDEELKEGIAHEPIPGAAVELYGINASENSYEEEASFVASRIYQMLQNGEVVRDNQSFRKIKPEDIVILLRSPGSVARYFQKELDKRGIRSSTGGGSDLLKTYEVSCFRSLLQTIENPRVDIPLASILASPLFGFTGNDLADFRSKRKKGSLYDALIADKSPKAVQFVSTLTRLRKLARNVRLSELMEACMQETRIDSLFGAMPDGEGRRINLLTFYQTAVDFEASGQKDLAQFLEYLDSMSEKGLIIAGQNTNDCVTIMSIHKSKGLEFPVVFLCGLSRNFNRESSRAQILCDKELGLGFSAVDTKNRVRYPTIAKKAISAKIIADSVSEELRVLYVAMTRAKDRLIMTYADHNLETELRDLSLRIDMQDISLLSSRVTCPGEWVLMSALCRTEAGEFFNVSGKPEKTNASDFPWLIRMIESEVYNAENQNKTEQKLPLSKEDEENLRHALAFRYPYLRATSYPSKQTATNRKGRAKDEEVTENTPQKSEKIHTWRKPSFITRSGRGKEYGNAFHAAMQYIDYSKCSSFESIERELRRMVSDGLLSNEQAAMVDCHRFEAFFSSEIGKKLLSGVECVREFKFSIMQDGSDYDEALAGEEILMQGVVDCAIIEDSITVVDFKTDFVTNEILFEKAKHYAPQIETYSDALERIFQKKVSGRYLYFVKLGRLIPV